MKNLMVCVDMSEKSLEVLEKSLKELDLDQFENIYYVHGFERTTFVDTFYLATHPMDENFPAIEKSIVETLKGLDEKVRHGSDLKNGYYSAFLSSFPKDVMCDFAKDKKIDQMIIATRGRSGIKGLFSSSFAEHMVRHAPCRLLILRE